MSDRRERIAAIIRALRAKTVANGCTEGEAMAAAAKAAEMLRDYDMTVDEAEMRASPFGQQTHAEPDDVGARLWKPAAAIAKLTGARFWTSGAGVEPAEHTFFGFTHEVAVAGYLLDICARAMRTERDRLKRSYAIFRPARQRLMIIPYLDGMADRLHERILALRPAEPTGTGLVVLRGALIDAALAEAGIQLTEGHGRRSRSGDAAYRQGRDAAEGVRLDPGVGHHGQSSAQLPGTQSHV